MTCAYCPKPGYQAFLIDGRRVMLCEDHTAEHLDIMAEAGREILEGTE